MRNIAEEFPPGVWFQVSRRYRTLARLPPGEDGFTALLRIARDRNEPCLEDWVAGQLECAYPETAKRHADDMYLRIYAESEKNTAELSMSDFSDWRKAGGGTR